MSSSSEIEDRRPPPSKKVRFCNQYLNEKQAKSSGDLDYDEALALKLLGR